jgi:hypothetical protein
VYSDFVADVSQRQTESAEFDLLQQGERSFGFAGTRTAEVHIR